MPKETIVKTHVAFSVVVLAKDEENNIVDCLLGIVSQSVFQHADTVAEIIIVANGCSDATAAVAQSFLEQCDLAPNISFSVLDVAEPGKSKAWNLAVHELVSAQSALLIFADSDIEFASPDVLDGMLSHMEERSDAAAFVGLPLKANERSFRRSITDRVSSVISRHTRYNDAICGQLYVIRADQAKLVWLPNETPGEDGFLDAMVKTLGFTTETGGTVLQSRQVTHYFEDLSLGQFIAHERRMIMGTVINRWIFEHMWSLSARNHGGETILRWNQDDPQWVQSIIDARIGKRRWVVPRGVVLRRFSHPRDVGIGRFSVRFPVALIATALSVPAMLVANRMLKRRGAASKW